MASPSPYPHHHHHHYHHHHSHVRPFSRMPKEILSKSLLHIKITSSASCLVQYLPCCKIWLDVTKPLLYSSINLTNSNLKTFNKNFNVTHAPLVRSLPITVDPVQPAQKAAAPYRDAFLEDEEDMKQHRSQHSNYLWSHFHVSADRIAGMVNMITFSPLPSPPFTAP